MAAIVPIVRQGIINKNDFPIATAYKNEKNEPTATFPIKD